MRPYGWTLTGKVAHLVDYGSVSMCGIQAPYKRLGDGGRIQVCKRCQKARELDRAAMAASLDRGLKQAAAGEIEDLGSFVPVLRVQFRRGQEPVLHSDLVAIGEPHTVECTGPDCPVCKFIGALPAKEDSENDGGVS